MDPQLVAALANSSPYWGPFLIALAMILSTGGYIFMKVISILSGGLSDKLDQGTVATKELSQNIAQGNVALARLVDALNKNTASSDLNTAGQAPVVVVNPAPK
jgi:hypothetical protein